MRQWTVFGIGLMLAAISVIVIYSVMYPGG